MGRRLQQREERMAVSLSGTEWMADRARSGGSRGRSLGLSTVHGVHNGHAAT